MIITVGAALHVVDQRRPRQRNQARQNVREAKADRGSFDTCVKRREKMLLDSKLS